MSPSETVSVIQKITFHCQVGITLPVKVSWIKARAGKEFSIINTHITCPASDICSFCGNVKKPNRRIKKSWKLIYWFPTETDFSNEQCLFNHTVFTLQTLNSIENLTSYSPKSLDLPLQSTEFSKTMECKPILFVDHYHLYGIKDSRIQFRLQIFFFFQKMFLPLYKSVWNSFILPAK